MTIETTQRKEFWNGNGVAVTFDFHFWIKEANDLRVYIKDPLGTMYLQQTLGVDYTLTGEGLHEGGSITFVNPPGTGVGNVRAFRYTDETQEVNYIESDDFPAETHELALDKLTAEVQDLSDSTIWYDPNTDAWNASNRAINLVGDPVLPKDAVNLEYFDAHNSTAEAQAAAAHAQAEAAIAEAQAQIAAAQVALAQAEVTKAQAEADRAAAEAAAAESWANISEGYSEDADGFQQAALDAKNAADVAKAAAETAAAIAEAAAVGLAMRGVVYTPFEPTQTWTISSINMTSGGSSYHADDFWYVYASGETKIPALIRVASVDANGTITSFDVTRAGAFDVSPAPADLIIVDGYLHGTGAVWEPIWSQANGTTLADILDPQPNNAAVVALSPGTGASEMWGYIDEDGSGTYHWVPMAPMGQERDFNLNPIQMSEVSNDIRIGIESSLKIYITTTKANALAYSTNHPGVLCLWQQL